jgi:hypothetical protein
MGLKTIKFDDMNWEKDYTANDAYSQSKLAQIISVSELQDRPGHCSIYLPSRAFPFDP